MKLRYLIPIPFIDLIFLFSTSVIFQKIFNASKDMFDNIQSLIAQQQTLLEQNRMSEVLTLSQTLQEEYKAVIIIIISLIVTLYLLWTVSQTAIWYLLARHEKIKPNLKSFIPINAATNLFAIITLAFVLSRLGDMMKTNTSQALTIITITLTILSYIIFTVFCITAKKVKSLKRSIIPFISIILTLNLSFWLITRSINISAWTTILTITLITLPLYTLARLWLMHDMHAKKPLFLKLFKQRKSAHTHVRKS